MAENVYFPLSEWVEASAWPIAALVPEALDAVWVSPPALDSAGERVYVAFLLDHELVLRIPGLDFVTLAVSQAGDGTELYLVIDVSPFKASLQAPVVLRVDASILRPMKPGTNEPDSEAKALSINLGTVGLAVNSNFDLDLGIRGRAISIPRCMIGQTGVILEIGKILWLTPSTPAADLPPPPTQVPSGFTGLFFDDVRIDIKDTPVKGIRLDDVFLGTGGLTGKARVPIPLSWDGPTRKYTGPAAGELFGFPCGITRVDIEVVQSTLQKGLVLGEIYLPYLDKRIGIELGLNSSGDFSVGFAPPQASNPETGVKLENGLLKLRKDGVLDAELDSIVFDRREGDISVRLSGRIRPLFAGVNWPGFEVKALTIHADGRVDLGGGWLDLPQQTATSFHGFPLEIRKVGFGSEGNQQWVGSPAGSNCWTAFLSADRWKA